MEYIGIIGAMEVEVNRLKALMDVEAVITMASMDFYKGCYHDKGVVIVRSGIGKVNAAICTQILVDIFKVGMVINTGIAGGLQAEINIGDIVISTDALQHDVDATGFGYEYGVIPQMERSVFTADETLVGLAEQICRQVNPDIEVFKGRIVSGDQFISERSIKEMIKSRFNAFCTEMEGAAIAQAAYLNRVPFVIIRAISDKADESAEMSYNEFEAQAVEHTVNLMDAMIRQVHI